MMVRRKRNFPLCEVAHTSFRSVRVIHRQREREAHAKKHTKDRGQSAVARGPVAAGTGGTPDRRSDDKTVVACPEDSWLGCQAAAGSLPRALRIAAWRSRRKSGNSRYSTVSVGSVR